MRIAILAGLVAVILATTAWWGYQRNAALSRVQAAGAQVSLSNADAWHGKLLWKVTGFSMGEAKPNDALLADMSAIAAVPAQLDLSGHPVTDEGVAALDCSMLTDLNLNDTKVSDAAVNELSGCDKLLSLKLAGTQVGDAGLESLAALEGLQTLSLARTKITDAGLQSYPQWQLLSGLDLSGTQLNGNFLQAVDKSCRLQSLSTDNSAIDMGKLSVLVNCESLQHLSLKGASVSNSGLDALARIKQLNSLDLSGSNLSGNGLRRLLNNSRLVKLVAADTDAGRKLGDRPLSAPDLEELDLSSSGLSDEDSVALKGLGQLKTLNLDGNPVTDAATVNLLALTRLETVRITDTNMPVASAHRLYKALPKAIIYYGNAGSVGWLGYTKK